MSVFFFSCICMFASLPKQPNVCVVARGRKGSGLLHCFTPTAPTPTVFIAQWLVVCKGMACPRGGSGIHLGFQMWGGKKGTGNTVCNTAVLWVGGQEHPPLARATLKSLPGGIYVPQSWRATHCVNV